MSEPIVEAMAEVRAHLADTVDRARREATPTIITRRGKAEAVILDLDEYQRLKKLEESVEDAWLSRLAADSLAEGREPTVTLEDLAAEILGEAGQA
ncbi:type II toxin-antitoxin system Phd/YefM family antitoxin [Streptomyces sp. NBC_01808]|uniref:type II toxin-antitoxin system Phd/YefM family antitoxin n=1 Tax=Streptomyces sp. NBC_01808 TaxID=2975947 RepID=UPI002DDBD337|nr:type II toxin-antitoxin system Phd/YefM family antitoxin [Streptomyces sp. NBC_01808]WSA39258.1 type II toxin-antitoxin system Phd/YefM family antitoxin [Streptomyces sp. NBC_01808]